MISGPSTIRLLLLLPCWCLRSCRHAWNLPQAASIPQAPKVEIAFSVRAHLKCETIATLLLTVVQLRSRVKRALGRQKCGFHVAWRQTNVRTNRWASSFKAQPLYQSGSELLLASVLEWNKTWPIKQRKIQKKLVETSSMRKEDMTMQSLLLILTLGISLF